jgi:hypothetical protein
MVRHDDSMLEFDFEQSTAAPAAPAEEVNIIVDFYKWFNEDFDARAPMYRGVVAYLKTLSDDEERALLAQGGVAEIARAAGFSV